MAKSIVRIPLDVPPGLREQFVARIKQVDHTMGLNTAIRYLMTCVCGWSEDRLAEELGWGRIYEQALLQGESKAYADFQSGKWRREVSVELVAKKMEVAVKALQDYMKVLGKK